MKEIGRNFQDNSIHNAEVGSSSLPIATSSLPLRILFKNEKTLN